MRPLVWAFAVAALACSEQVGPPSSLRPVDSSMVAIPFPGRVLALTLPNPYGQASEPDVILDWHGWRYWLAFNVRDTAQALVRSQNGLFFEIPPGAPPSISDDGSGGRSSDPDIVVVGDSLWYAFRRNTLLQDWLAVRVSGDGATWSRERRLGSPAPFASLVGPALLVLRGVLHLWSVNAHDGGCAAAQTVVEHRSGLDGFLAVDTVAVGEPGYAVWHLDAVQFGETLWLLLAAHPTTTSCAERNHVFLASSVDSGHSWTAYPKPIDPPGLFASGAYRSTLAVEGDTVTLWYSGFSSGQWGLKTERLRVDSLLARAGAR